MFSKFSKKTTIDQEQKAQFEYAVKRIRQKKRLYKHFVMFLIGSVLIIVVNKGLGMGQEFFIQDWYIWAILIWLFILLYHVFNVYVTHKILGPDWESEQLEKLKAKQEARIAKLKKQLPEDSSLEEAPANTNKITLIAAAGANNELGKDNDLVWHLPIDFKRFKELTTGHHIIMGRKTFETFPKLLPNRIHVVITRNTDYVNKNVLVVHSLEEALKISTNDKQPYIIGGGEIYEQALPFAHKIELTRVHGAFDADTHFPKIDEKNWKLINSEKHKKDDRHAYDFDFETYIRR